MAVEQNKLYNPTFQWGFLHPKYWLTWIAVFFAFLISLLPHQFRDWLAKIIAKKVMTLDNRANKRSNKNLSLCFPQKSKEERESILFSTYRTGINYILAFASISLLSKEKLDKKTHIIGMEHLQKHIDNKENIILLVPHSWAVDLPAILLASKGLPITTIMKEQKNPIYNWLIHKQRMQYGGRIYERDAGIKPFLKSIKEGFLGYYLPDEDHGPEQSVFAPFFATEKATLTVIGKLARMTKGKMVPIMAGFDANSGQFLVEVYPALEDFPTKDDMQDATKVNDQITDMFTKYPEQYMWILNLVKSRRDGSKNY